MLHNPVFDAILKRYPEGHIYQGFGENPELYSKSTNGLIIAHNGIDIAMPEGTPILATAGIVCDVKNSPEGYGKHVRILTDPIDGIYYELTYGHLKDIFVPMGLKIPAGYTIGTMGNTGFVISGSTPYWGNAPTGRGVHLHFGVRECSIIPTAWLVTYTSGLKAYIKNYENGLHGAIDPMPLINPIIEKKTILLAIQRAVENIMAILNKKW